MTHVVATVEGACAKAQGQTAGAMARTVVEAFVSAKFADHAASRALYAVAAEVGGASVVALMTQRSQLALSNMLATASDTTYGNLADISFVLSTAAVGPTQGLLASNATPKSVHAIQQQLTLMMCAYLNAAGTAKRSANKRT